MFMEIFLITNRKLIRKNGQERFDESYRGPALDSIRFGLYNTELNDYQIYPDKVFGVKDAALASSPTVAYYDKNALNTDKSLKGSERFFTDLYHCMSGQGGNQRGDVLTFIHGYNCNFQCGIDHIKEMAKELEVAGSPIKHFVLVSWPSRGRILRYQDERDDAHTSGGALGRAVQMLVEFFRTVFGANGSDPCGQHIHLMCHSMGNQVLEEMMRKLMELRAPVPSVFEEVILAASDVDNTAFELPNPLGALPSLCRRVHVYTNRNDLALVISKNTKTSVKRMGTDGPSDVSKIPSHIYLVDCTDVASQGVLGLKNELVQHWYHKYVTAVVSDIAAVLRGENDESIGNRTTVSPIKYRIKPKS